MNAILVASGLPISESNPLPVVILPPGIATAGTAAAIAAVDAAADRVDTYTYLDAGTADERLSTIVHTSASLALGYTETVAHAGAPGAYRIASVTRS
jgi:hypothetical protein